MSSVNLTAKLPQQVLYNFEWLAEAHYILPDLMQQQVLHSPIQPMQIYTREARHTAWEFGTLVGDSD